MLLEEWSQSSPYHNANDKMFERESLNVVIPQLAALTQPPRAFEVPTSPRDWFGNQNTFNSWYQSSNKTTTVAPSTPSWVCKSFGLDSGKESGNSRFSMSTKTSLPGFQRHQMTTQEGLHAKNCRLPGDGVSRSGADKSKSVDSWCEKNMHPCGGCWLEDVSCESDNFVCDPYEVQTTELPHPTSAYYQKARSQRKNFVYKRKNLGKNFMGKRNKIHISRRKLLSYGISRNVLKFFAKSIGYRNFGSHSSICEILDYIIESKLVYRSCKCFRGSKLLQLQIINSNKGDRMDILEQVFQKLISICNDKYGNHVVQCFFRLNNPSVERDLLLRMKRSLCDLAISEYGSRVLQSAILLVNDEVLRIVTDVIVPKALMLAMNNYGHHVLLRVIERGSGAIVQMLFANVIGTRGKSKLIELSKDVFGCTIIQKMLEIAHPPERVLIIDAIIGSTHDLVALCEDQYGNYVVQQILSRFREKHSMAVMDVLEGKLSKMAKNKFCSNVLEVLYKQGGSEVEDRLINLVDRNLLTEFLNNKFANYLIQTMLTAGKPENRKKLRRLLLKIPHLRKLKYGKFVTELL